MGLEIALILIAMLAIVGYGWSRRKRRVFHEDHPHEGIICIVSYYDRAKTMPLIEAFFDQEYITVRDIKREIKRVGNDDLFTNTYELGLPRRVNQGRLVGYLSSISTVTSVQIRPK